MERIDLFLRLPQGAVCVEVGVRHADLGSAVLDRRPDLKYFGVDSWEGKFADAHKDATAKIGNRGTLIHLESEVAALSWTGPRADLVYIDAAHDYNNVILDIEAWFRIVRTGGILAGHDYEMKPDDGFWGPIEVKKAVDDWARQNGFQVNTTDDDPPSWWVVKE